MNPVDDFLKTAGLLDTLGRSLRGIGGGGSTKAGPTMRNRISKGLDYVIPGAVIGSGMAAGAEATAGAFSFLHDRLTKTRDYKAMLEVAPSLAKFDAGQVQMVFNSLRSQAPDMSRDPLTAGSFVRKILEVAPESGPFVDPATSKLLVDTQRSISQARNERGSISQAFKPTAMLPMGSDDALPGSFGG